MSDLLRTDQVGSLLRPAALLAARRSHAAGELSLEALREAEDAAVLAALQRQHDVGIGIVTDGEFRRKAWMTNVSEAVDGFVDHSRVMAWHDASGEVVHEPSYSKVVGAKLRPLRRITAVDSAFLLRHAPGPFKITLPSPSVVAGAGFLPGTTDGAYRDVAELSADVLDILRQELVALAAEGVEYVQLDEGFTRFVSDVWRRDLSSQEAARTIEQAVALENDCFAALPADVPITKAIHICRGNSRSRWTSSGGYEALAEQVFADVEVDRFLLEYDSERAGGFEPLRFMPKGKIAVLGLISSKFGELESRDTIMKRIDEAARFLSIDQLALSPQCGFASVDLGNELSEDEQYRKLELVVRVASEVWRD